MFCCVGEQGHIAGLLDCCAQAALVFGAGTSFAARFDLATIGDEPFHEAVDILIVNLANMLVAELTYLTA
jgi:hypothetical protein